MDKDLATLITLLLTTHQLEHWDHQIQVYYRSPEAVIRRLVIPKLWNTLPINIREANTLDTFKRQLKTYLFTKAFYKFSVGLILTVTFTIFTISEGFYSFYSFYTLYHDFSNP